MKVGNKKGKQHFAWVLVVFVGFFRECGVLSMVVLLFVLHHLLVGYSNIAHAALKHLLIMIYVISCKKRCLLFRAGEARQHKLNYVVSCLFTSSYRPRRYCCCCCCRCSNCFSFWPLIWMGTKGWLPWRGRNLWTCPVSRVGVDWTNVP